MPAVIQQWLLSEDVRDCQRIQDELIESYRQDFHKYAKDRQIYHVTKVFENIPNQFGGKFMYSQIDSEVRSLYYKEALSLLNHAGIAYYCHHTSAQHQPLGAMTDEKKFKVFFLDIGLAQRLLGLDVAQWLLNPVHWSNAGRVAEQLVAQELIAYSPHHKKAQLFYWHREAKSSNAEVDFVVVKGGHVIPVEVKSSVKGRLKSLRLFLEKYQDSPYGLKISEGVFNTQEKLVEIPFYAIRSWMSEND